MAHTPQRQENGREEPKRGRRERQAACSRGHQCWLGPEGAGAQGGPRKSVWSESQSAPDSLGWWKQERVEAQSSGGCFPYSGQMPFLEAAWAPQALSRTDGVCDVRPGWGSRGRGRKNLTSTTWLACCWQGRVQMPWPGDTLGGVPAAFGRPPAPRGGCLPGGTHERTSLGPPWDRTEGHVPGSGASLPRGQATASPAEGPDPPP